MAHLTGESVISFGEHQGSKLKDIPRSYFLFLWKKGKYNNEMGSYMHEVLGFTYEDGR